MSNSIFFELFSERYKSFIPDFDQFLDSLELELPIGLRLNSQLCELESFLLRFQLRPDQFHLPIEGLPYLEVQNEKSYWGGALEHHLGFYYIQALSSLLPSLALAPCSEDRILDMCAAPGGKTTHLAELMNQEGLIIANEPHLGRRRILKASMARMSVSNTIVCGEEGQNLDFPAQSFSKILLDGPCSSEGTLRVPHIRPGKKRDRSYLTYNKGFREELHQVQRELLDQAYVLLRPGGTLVYSTCTYDPLENEAQVNRLLHKFEDLELVSLGVDSAWNQFLCDGITSYAGHAYKPELSLTKRVYPHRLNSIGFYVSKFVKRSR